MARKALSKRARFEVFKRDGFVCQYCGDHPPAVVLHVDHIIPVADGGTNDVDNLITACSGCNLGKGAVPLSRVPKSIAQKTAEVAEREAQIAGYAEVMQARASRLDGETWKVADILWDNAMTTIGRSHYVSISGFIDKLGYHETAASADIARARIPHDAAQRFKYFCGVCWSKIREGK